ncbi:unnamed protein product [Pleuronectes platessa]|uniref:Uncharacterized protein n=1 Tax=Pleuronectes platessa TaxID=8262 RepID=A0A9N7Y241_PLEPL|nr:unnamed protein product [Pleuronectes platessa]
MVINTECGRSETQRTGREGENEVEDGGGDGVLTAELEAEDPEDSGSLPSPSSPSNQGTCTSDLLRCSRTSVNTPVLEWPRPSDGATWQRGMEPLAQPIGRSASIFSCYCVKDN